MKPILPAVYFKHLLLSLATLALLVCTTPSHAAGGCCGGSSRAEGVNTRFHFMMCVDGTAKGKLKGRNIDDGAGNPKEIVSLTATGATNNYSSDTAYQTLVVGEEYTLSTTISSGGTLYTTHIGIQVPAGYTVEIDQKETSEINWVEQGTGTWTVVVRSVGCCGGLMPGEASEPETGSVTWGVDLGAMPNGSPAGRLMLREASLTSDSYTRSRWIYAEPSGEYTGGNDFVTVTRVSGDLTKIATGMAVVELTDLTSPDGVQIAFYEDDGTGSKTGNAYAVWQVTDTSPGGSPNTKIKFEKTTGGDAAADTYEVTYNASPGGGADYSWTMVTGDGSGADPDLRKVVRTTTITGSGVGQVRTEVIEIKDTNDTVVRKTTEKHETFAWGEEMIERVLDPDGDALTTKWSYYDTDTEVGRYGQVKSIEYEDGSWVQHDYYYSTDVQGIVDNINNGTPPAGKTVFDLLKDLGKLGQLKQELRAWDDVALSSNPDQFDVYSVDYDWEPILKNSAFNSQDGIVTDQLSTEKHYIPDGNSTTRTQIENRSVERDYNHVSSWIPKNAYVVKDTRFLDPDNVADAGQSIVTESLMSRWDIDADYTTPDWTVDADTAGHPLWEKMDDGRMIVYQHEAGAYTDTGVPNAAAFSTASDDGSWRVTQVYGVKLTAAPGGADVEYPNSTLQTAADYQNAVKLIADHSTKDVTVYDKHGRVSLMEMHTWDGTAWTRRQWTVTRYNIEGQPTSQHFHDGTSSTTTYGSDNRVSSITHRNGLKTDYTYDEAGRRDSAKHFADLATDIILSETNTTYDAAGSVIKTERTPDGGVKYTVSEAEYDKAGRVTQRKDALGKLVFYAYNDVKVTGADYVHGTDTGPWFNETRVYAHNKDSGPVRVAWTDNQGSTVRRWEGTSTATWSEAAPPTAATTVTESARTTMSYEAPGRVDKTWVYFDLASLALNQDGTKGTNYYESEVLAYDMTSRPIRTKDAIGDITARVYDGQRLTQVWRGLDDTGADIDDPSGAGAGGNDMVQVSQNYYDSDRDGTGDPLGYATRSKALKPVTTDPPMFAANSTTTDFEQTYTASGMVSWDKPALGPWSKQVTDYQGRSAESSTYKNGNTAYVLTKSTSHYDDGNSRPWRMTAGRVHEANGTGGTTGYYLETTYAYDDAERRVKVITPAGGFTKTAFDSENRVARTVFASAEGTNTDVDAFTDDIVLTETIFTYDTLGNVVKTVTHVRNHDAGTAGGLLSGNLAKARTTTAMTWFDDAHRPTHRVAFGTNTPPAAHDDPTTDTAPEPNTSDDYLVTKLEYSSDGEQYQVTDNLGRKTRSEFDDLGRTTKLIENYVDGAPLDASPDEDRVTTYAYNAAGQVTEQTADLEGAGNDQTTKYIYSSELTDKGSPVKSNALLRAVIYPDSDDTVASNALSNGTDMTYDRVETTYMANGQVATRKDQRAITLTSVYDEVGRRTEQKVTAGTVDGDQQFKTTYTDLSQPEKVTAYSVIDMTVSSEVQYAYNGYQQVETEYQEHGGAVNTGTSNKVQYAYDTAATGFAHTKGHRLKTTTYPNGRVIHAVYDGHAGIDDAVSRVNKLAEDNAGSPGDTIVSYDYLGSGRMVKKTYPTDTGTHSGDTVRLDFFGGTSDAYAGLDAFGRVTAQRWIHYTDAADDNTFADSDHLHIAHGYDRNSNRQYDDRRVSASYSKVYTRDGLDRITEDQQGKIKSDKSGVEDLWVTGGAAYELDPLGGILSVDPLHRFQDKVIKYTYNKANEPTAIEYKGDHEGRQYFHSTFSNAAQTDRWELPAGSGDTFAIDSGGNDQLTFTLSQDTYDGVTEPEACAVLLWKDSEDIGKAEFAGYMNPTNDKQVGFVFGYKSPNDYYIAVAGDGTAATAVYHIDGSGGGTATKTLVGTIDLLENNDRFSVINLRDVFNGNGFPVGRIGIWTNSVSNEIEEALAYPEARGYPLGGRWQYTEAAYKASDTRIDPSGDHLAFGHQFEVGRNHHGEYAAALMDGITAERFQVTFSAKYTSTSAYAMLKLQHQGDEKFFQVGLRGNGSIQSIKVDNDTPTNISYTSGTVPSIAANDTLWFRYVSDGSSLDGYVQNSATEPSEASWGVANKFITVSTLPYASGGGIGLGIRQNTDLPFDHVELLLDSDADGDYTDADATPVLVDTFTVDANAYRDLGPEHDKAGNLTFDGRKRYTYDAWNRLVKIAYAFKDANHDSGNLTSHGMVAEYRYDASGRRIEKKVYVGGIHDGTEHFYYTGWSTIETRNGSDQVTQQHVWDSMAGHYIDSLTQVGNNTNPGVDDDAGTSGTQDYVDDHYYALQDQQFNVMAIVDDTGAIVERYAYTLYGERTIMNGSYVVLHQSAYGVVHGFQGLMHDAESGLIYNRARMLSPRLERFIQRDPLGYPDGMSTYAAYHVMRGTTDPSGMAAKSSKVLAGRAELFGNLRLRFLGKYNFKTAKYPDRALFDKVEYRNPIKQGNFTYQDFIIDYYMNKSGNKAYWWVQENVTLIEAEDAQGNTLLTRSVFSTDVDYVSGQGWADLRGNADAAISDLIASLGQFVNGKLVCKYRIGSSGSSILIDDRPEVLTGRGLEGFDKQKHGDLVNDPRVSAGRGSMMTTHDRMALFESDEMTAETDDDSSNKWIQLEDAKVRYYWSFRRWSEGRYDASTNKIKVTDAGIKWTGMKNFQNLDISDPQGW